MQPAKTFHYMKSERKSKKKTNAKQITSLAELNKMMEWSSIWLEEFTEARQKNEKDLETMAQRARLNVESNPQLRNELQTSNIAPSLSCVMYKEGEMNVLNLMFGSAQLNKMRLENEKAKILNDIASLILDS
jgi:hypothetical protein